jgi:hypothetical protein
MATLVLHVELQQRPQILRPSVRGPVDPARVQLRGVELEPVETDDLFLHLAVGLTQQPAAIPVEIAPDEELVIDIAGRIRADVETVVATGAAAKPVSLPREHDVARGGRRNVGALESGQQIRAQVQMNPGTRPDEGIQPGTDTVGGRFGRLQLHQQLPTQVIRIVVEELLEIQDVRAQPRQHHRRHHRTYAALTALGPGIYTDIGTDDDLLAGITCSGPQLLQSVDVRPGRRSRCQSNR